MEEFNRRLFLKFITYVTFVYNQSLTNNSVNLLKFNLNAMIDCVFDFFLVFKKFFTSRRVDAKNLVKQVCGMYINKINNLLFINV